MATIKQIEANRRNSRLSTGPSEAGRAVSRMNALKTGIDAQSQIIPGEDPEALARLAGQYYDRFLPQGPEEAALIDTAIASDWLLRRLRKTEAEIWDRSITDKLENEQKWNKKPERHRLAVAYQGDSKLLERLQRRITAAERSLRASLETLARLRKVGPALLAASSEVGQAAEGPSRISPGSQPVAPVVSAKVAPVVSAKVAPVVSAKVAPVVFATGDVLLSPTLSPATHSKQSSNGFVPKNLPDPSEPSLETPLAPAPDLPPGPDCPSGS